MKDANCKHLKSKGSKIEDVQNGRVGGRPATSVVEGDPIQRAMGNYKKGAKTPSMDDLIGSSLPSVTAWKM